MRSEKIVISKVKPCEICGSSCASFFLKTHGWNWTPEKNFYLVKCKECGLVYLNNQIHEDDLNNRYSHESNEKRPVYVAAVFRFVMGSFMRLRARKIEKSKNTGAILDVGCADGLFLSTMRDRGWHCFGVDITPRPLKTPGGKEKIEFRCGLLQNLDLPRDFFDVITFWHSFEHVARPCEVIQKARALLKNNGVIFISVPNLESLEARMNKKKWFGMELPAHQYHYTPSTLLRVIEKNGFKARVVQKNSLEYNFPFFAQSLFNSLGGVHDFLQKRFKGYKSRYRANPWREAYSALLIATLSPFTVMMTIALYFVNLITGNGPVIEVIARKNAQKD